MLRRVGAAQHRVEEPAVQVAVHPRRGGRLGVVTGRIGWRLSVIPTGAFTARAQRVDRQPVREQQVVRDAQRGRPVPDARAPCAPRRGRGTRRPTARCA